MRSFMLVFLVACGSAKPAPAPTAKPAATAIPAAPEDCPAGQLMHEDHCLKECAQESDCAKGEICEQLHVMNEDGTIGPVSGNACTSP